MQRGRGIDLEGKSKKQRMMEEELRERGNGIQREMGNWRKERRRKSLSGGFKKHLKEIIRRGKRRIEQKNWLLLIEIILFFSTWFTFS